MESFHKALLSATRTEQGPNTLIFIFHLVVLKDCEVLWKNVLWEDKAQHGGAPVLVIAHQYKLCAHIGMRNTELGALP